MVGLYRDPDGKNVFTSSMQATPEKTNSVSHGSQMEEIKSSMQKKQEEVSLQLPLVNTRSNFLACIILLLTFAMWLLSL